MELARGRQLGRRLVVEGAQVLVFDRHRFKVATMHPTSGTDDARRVNVAEHVIVVMVARLVTQLLSASLVRVV